MYFMGPEQYRRCPSNWFVWNHLLPPSLHANFFQLDLKEWFLQNMQSQEMVNVQNMQSQKMVNGKCWRLIFVVELDYIWWNKNSFIFEGVHNQPYMIVGRVWKNVVAIDVRLKRCNSLAPLSLQPVMNDPIRWCCTLKNFYKINCNTIVNQTSMNTTVGAVF